MKKFLKNQKGVTGVDAVVAVAIAVLFAGIIFTLAYNIYITTNSLKRSSQALSYITSTFEYVATQYYDDVTKDNIEKYINGNEENIVALDKTKLSTGDNTPYKAEVTVTKYNETEGNEEKVDLVKEIKMSVTYKLGDKEQKIEMTTAKAREKLQVPNSPELDNLQVEENENKYAIKYVEGKWEITTTNDANWYNYEDGIWATVLVAEQQKAAGDEVTKDDGTIYLWLPSFAYDKDDTSNIEILYKNTKRQIVDEKTIDTEDTNLTIDNKFKNITGIWINEKDLTQETLCTYFQNKYVLDTAKYEGKLW